MGLNGSEVYDGPPLDEARLARLLDGVADGNTPVAEALESLRSLPYEQVPDAKVDHHRELRTGHPEAIYGPGKTLDQIRDIAVALASRAATPSRSADHSPARVIRAAAICRAASVC